MYVLGINAYHGDASACLVKDGELIVAIEEERLNRIKHCAGFPKLAARYCLDKAGIDPADLDHVAIARKPSAPLERKLAFAVSHLADTKRLKSVLSRAAKVVNLKGELAQGLEVEVSTSRAQVHRVEHHRAHAASSFLVSPFEQSALPTIDGCG